MQFYAFLYKLFCLVLCTSLITIVSDANPSKLVALERRQELYPSNLKVKYVLARAYANRGKSDPRFYDKSINKLQEILKIKQIAVVKFYLGLMHARKGNLDRAINQWTTVVRSLKPNNLTTLRYLALVHEKKVSFLSL